MTAARLSVTRTRPLLTRTRPPNLNAPQATLRNSRDSLEYDRVVSEEGDIFCEVERRDALGPKLERIKYEGDEETHIRALNVNVHDLPRLSRANRRAR
jgi:hypothetical protein